MQSNKSLAVWASQTYPQGSGESNWTQYQLSLTGSSYKFNIYSTNNTSTTFSYYANVNGVNIANGDTLLLSTNGSSFTSGTAGVVTTTPPTPAGPGSMTAGQTSAVSVTAGPNTYITPDGLTLYTNNYYGGGATGYIYQYSLPTAFSFTGATYTGKSWTMPVTVGSYGMGFTFKPDGTVLYVTKNTIVYSYALGTAWDISTAAAYPMGSVTLARPITTGNWTGGPNGWGSIRFSPDGTKLILKNDPIDSLTNSGYENFAVFTLSVPWVLGSAATTTTNYSNATSFRTTGYSYSGGFNFSPDGLFLIVNSNYYGGPSCNSSGVRFAFFSLTVPYDFSTFTLISGYGNSWNPSGTGTALTVSWFFNGTGTAINWNSPSAGYRSGTSGNEWYAKYNVNVSGFGLGAAATYGYTPAPTVKVGAETTAARVTLFDYQVYMASSTTTQAVVYKPAAGYIATGDTLSLNGTTTVTTSSVTEGTTGAVAAVPIYTAANRTYANKNLGLMANDSTNAVSNMRISTDGTLAIFAITAGTYGAGLYGYSMTTPFDLSTASFNGMFVAVTSPGSSYIPFDISPDGTRLILWSSYITGSTVTSTTPFSLVYNYRLVQPWNISTGVYLNSWSSTLDMTTGTGYSMRFTSNGSQVVFTYYSSSTFYIYYASLGTAYNISTAGGKTLLATGGSQRITNAFLTPDGKALITCGATGTTSNVLTTANSLSTIVISNDIDSPYVKWLWPSGTVGSGTQSATSCGDFSADGTKFYAVSYGTPNNTAWQFNVMVIPQTSYTCTFPTQGSAPTSVVVPDRSVEQTITTTLSGGNMTFAASAVGTNARGIAMKITSPRAYTTITNATLSMWKS